MLAQVQLAVSGWHWVGFVTAILIFLALDLGLFHKQAHVVKFKEALSWTVVWVLVALSFGFFIAPAMVGDWGSDDTKEFLVGYGLELSLSMDNVFVIALIFSYFGVPLSQQHRVLFWGILGALAMRGGMIWLGTELIKTFSWALYVFGAFLVITGIKMLFAGDDEIDPGKNMVLKITRKIFPVSDKMEGAHFTTRINGRFALTPLALVLVMVETTDLVFAVDSIPAIFVVTQKPFIVFTSNVFAILGLRSLYFVLAGAIGYFRFLKIGLALVLTFIGAKMLLAKYFHIDTNISMFVIVGLIAGSILVSILASPKKAQAMPGSTDKSN